MNSYVLKICDFGSAKKLSRGVFYKFINFINNLLKKNYNSQMNLIYPIYALDTIERLN